MEFKVGLRGQAETVVNETNTATAACSGALPGFGTPFLIALMERAAWSSLESRLDEGQSSVGTKIAISHLAATPMGMTVRAESEVTAVDGRRLEFKVTAYDEAGLIAEGTHERFVVTADRFLSKAAEKGRK